jgi:GNAT superfamily N-acetyltransferase
MIRVVRVNNRRFECRLGADVIGRLDLSYEGEIQWITVTPHYRRRGYATELYRAALLSGIDVRHSPQRTIDGHYWAQAVGGELPEWEGV